MILWPVETLNGNVGTEGEWKEEEEIRSMYCKVLNGRPSLCVYMSYGCFALLIAPMIAND